MTEPDPRLVAALAEALRASAMGTRSRIDYFEAPTLASAILPGFLTDPRTHEWLAERLDGTLPRMAFHQYGQFYNDDPDFNIEEYYQRVAAAILGREP